MSPTSWPAWPSLPAATVPWLRSLRHQVQEEPDPGWLRRPDVIAGLRAVADAGLAYDLILRPHQLAAATYAAQSVPQLSFVLDHGGEAAGRRRRAGAVGQRRGGAGAGRLPGRRLQAVRPGYRGRAGGRRRARCGRSPMSYWAPLVRTG